MTADVRETTPNPGSSEAIKAGCLCPRMDNHNGTGIRTWDGLKFWTDPECPLHGTENASQEARNA